MVDLGWEDEAIGQYESIRSRAYLSPQLEVIDQMLDMIELNPGDPRARKTELKALDGTPVWKIDRQAGRYELSVLWQFSYDQPTVIWVGQSDYTSL